VANCVWRCQIHRQYQMESAAWAQRPAPAALEKQAEWSGRSLVSHIVVSHVNLGCL